MKTVLITGSNGYIASSLNRALMDRYNVVNISRKDFDLTDVRETFEWFNSRYFDIVIHCAGRGGSRLTEDKIDVLDDNLNMYYNLLRHKSHYNKFINIGSGAELYGSGYYALSKKVICESVLNHDNFYNLRVFGIFDENELDTRFIKANILRYINRQPMIIHNDKYMDFFYMKDFVSLVEYYIETETLDKEIDCCYAEQYRLSDIAHIINQLDEWTSHIDCGDVLSQNYTGAHSLPISCQGLETGIKEVYKKLCKI
jgi:nucleoside-diphosphate-sugar epimerase